MPRKTFYLLLLLCLIVPHLFSEAHFFLMGLSLVLGAFLLRLWEKKLRKSVADLVHIKSVALANAEVAKSQEYEQQIALLQSAMDKKVEEVRHLYLEYEDMRHEVKRLQEEQNQNSGLFDAQLKNKESLLTEYLQTINEQRTIIEKKQRYTLKLEERVRELMYEIRSLLGLENPSTGPLLGLTKKEELTKYYLPENSYDLSYQLQKCVEIAENFTGGDHLGLHASTLDLRRLFDLFRERKKGVIVIYSQVEERLLFVSNAIKTLLDITPERFAKEAFDLSAKGKEWQTLLTNVQAEEEQISFELPSKEGLALRVNCVMRGIMKGPLLGHAIGVFAESTLSTKRA